MGFRILAALCGVVAIWQLVFGKHISRHWTLPGSDEVSQVDEVVSGVQLPVEPTALMVSDKFGHSRWTVSIPHNASFPLESKQYQSICRQSQAMQDSIADKSRLAKAKDWRRKYSYYSIDRTFMEVDEAENSHALPKSAVKPTGHICEKSLTFAMDTEDASFGKSLLMLWMSYGLAKKEGRAFFIDDTRWPYGKYTSYFQPLPSPECTPPSPHQIVPCPHNAKHIIVSAATAPWTFGKAFERDFLQSRRHGSDKNRRIYDLTRRGYEDLFVMKGEDALYASSRLARFEEEAHQHSGSVVGLQIRRGDLHPLEYQYSQDYLPLERYASAARSMLRRKLRPLSGTHTPMADHDTNSEDYHSPLLLASDDPEIFSSTELADSAAPFTIQKAQERILLATKTTLDLANPVYDMRPPDSAYVKHIDENSGWEGGFYSSLFLSLGKPRTPTIPQRPGEASSTKDDLPLSEETMRMREMIGRSYLLDLAILGESDGVVCAVSSASCRLLGVMLGWDAIKDGRWVNVDDGRPWSWDGRR